MTYYTNEDFQKVYKEIQNLVPGSKSTLKEIKNLTLAFEIVISLIISQNLSKDLYSKAYDTYIKVCLMNKTGLSSLDNTLKSKEIKHLKQTFRNFNYCLKPTLIEEIDIKTMLELYYEDLKALLPLVKNNKLSNLIALKIIKVIEELNILLYKNALNESDDLAVHMTLFLGEFIYNNMGDNYLKTYLENLLKDLNFRGETITKYPLRLP